MPGGTCDPEKLWRRGCLHGIRASLERDRVRVTLGFSGIVQTVRLETVAPEPGCSVCSVTPLVDGRLRNGRVGRLDKEEDLSLSSLKLVGYRSSVAVQRDRFKCQLIEPKECKPISKPSQPWSRSLTSSVETCVKVLADNCSSWI
jgi:hypothetical protein